MRNIIRVIVFVVLFIIFNGIAIANSIDLADNGVFTDGNVLYYAPYAPFLSRGATKVNNYKISYDGYTGDVILFGRDHPTGSKVAVVYNKNNTNLVWLGSPNDNAWKLYKLNYDPQGTIIALLIFVVLCLADEVYIFHK